MNNQKDLQVIIKARQLVVHTVRLTSNANRYPKKYRYALVDKMQRLSMEILTALLHANRTDIRTFKRERLELQTKAITYCDELLMYIEMSHELEIINAPSMENWSKMVCDIKRMTIAWRTKDRER